MFVSVAAGVTVEFVEGKLNKVPSVKVIRTMPNTPCLVLSGVVVYCLGKNCSSDEGEMLTSLMKVVGHIEEVDEKHVDAMTSLMGCSIAWFYNVIEGISDGGVKNGVPRDVSYRLTAKAMEGAAKMVFESGKHVGQLKDEVTSPNGSTIAGIYELEQVGLRGIFMRAVQAATDRNKELGRQ
jgi:pyrroline-5-carboxylate reductase